MKYQKGDFLLVPNKSAILDMHGAALNVYLVLLAHANGNGICWPAYEVLVEKTGYQRRSCQLAVDELERRGLIRREFRNIRGRQTSNKFQILLLKIED